MIPKNAMLRDKVKEFIRKENQIELDGVKKMDIDDFQGLYHISRRLNQCIKKRANSMLSGSSINLIEVADLLSLINERLVIEGESLEDAIKEMTILDKVYGQYTKHYTSKRELDIDSDVFLEYVDRGKIVTDRDYVSRKSRIKEGKEY